MHLLRLWLCSLRVFILLLDYLCLVPSLPVTFLALPPCLYHTHFVCLLLKILLLLMPSISCTNFFTYKSTNLWQLLLLLHQSLIHHNLHALGCHCKRWNGARGAAEHLHALLSCSYPHVLASEPRMDCNPVALAAAAALLLWELHPLPAWSRDTGAGGKWARRRGWGLGSTWRWRGGNDNLLLPFRQACRGKLLPLRVAGACAVKALQTLIDRGLGGVTSLRELRPALRKPPDRPNPAVRPICAHTSDATLLAQRPNKLRPRSGLTAPVATQACVSSITMLACLTLCKSKRRSPWSTASRQDGDTAASAPAPAPASSSAAATSAGAAAAAAAGALSASPDTPSNHPWVSWGVVWVLSEERGRSACCCCSCSCCGDRQWCAWSGVASLQACSCPCLCGDPCNQSPGMRAAA
mmetsp:Transcript_11606/g.30325  ORF Transcript_11606/g.30325 Transcript_11606/m.30325 type:complete len:410 (-) Transcript_11606:74-1303(-)